MDKEILVNKYYEEGKKLINQLDKQGNKFPIIFWTNNSERNDWILIFGIHRLKTTGSKDILKSIHKIIIKNDLNLSLNDISLIDSTSEICQELKLIVTTGVEVSRISLFGNFINGRKFPDSIVYRVN